MIKPRVVLFLFLAVFFNSVKAQVFWTEDFNKGSIKQVADGYVGTSGTWSVAAKGPQGTNANEWFVSCAEEGKPQGTCATPCTAQNNGSLHISTSGDIGATYTKGPGGETSKRAMSPVIDLTGKSSVLLEFNFIGFGDTTSKLDFCEVVYSLNGGTTWLTLQSNISSFYCSSAQSMWRLFSSLLPSGADNNANFKIGFQWTNNDDNIGTDPAFAIDSIRLSIKPLNTITAGTIVGSPFCACSSVKVPFTSTGTFDPSNIYTAQLSDSAGNFQTPVDIGFISSNAATGIINAIIPCDTKSGTKYRIRVKSSSPSFAGDDNGQNIIIDAPINVVVTPNPDTICLGQKIHLKATGAKQYEWLTLPIINTSDTLDASPIKDTVYIVRGTTGACKDTAYAKVFVDKPPVVKVTNDTICKGMVAMLVASTTGSGPVKYVWNTGSLNDTIVESPKKDTMYIVTVTKGHCSVKDTGYVKVFDSIKVSVNSPSTCAGSPVKLTATGAITYVWNTVPVQTTSSITVAPLVTTVYTVTGTAGACSDKATATVTIVPGPDVKITATPPEICKGQSVILKATGAEAYVWDTGDTTSTITKKPLVTTTYVVVGKKGDCKATASIVINVSTPPIVLVAPAVICLGQTAVLIATGATNYVWNTKPPTLTDTLKVTPTKDTSYTVYGFKGACIDTAVGVISVGKPVPIVITGNPLIYACESTQLIALPADGSYSWEPAESVDCSTCSSVIASPLNTQEYIVTYTSPYGCIAKDSLTVTVIKANSYYMPTALTPNGDGVNDVVQVHGRGITRVSLKIFDRIGEKVFETNELETPWDGTLHGMTMNDNVLVYTLELEYCNGEVVKETGNITIVR